MHQDELTVETDRENRQLEIDNFILKGRVEELESLNQKENVPNSKDVFLHPSQNVFKNIS